MKIVTDRRVLAEVLSISRIYSRHGRFDLARKLLRNFILVEEKQLHPDFYSLALSYFNLGEVYSDQGNYLISSDLQRQAAEFWQTSTEDNPAEVLWYSNALVQLEKETDSLLHKEQESEVRRDMAS